MNKDLLGVLVISAPIMVLFGLTVYRNGWEESIKAWAFSLMFTSLIIAGVYVGLGLIND